MNTKRVKQATLQVKQLLEEYTAKELSEAVRILKGKADKLETFLTSLTSDKKKKTKQKIDIDILPIDNDAKMQNSDDDSYLRLADRIIKG
jgi:hypothetical protein